MRAPPLRLALLEKVMPVVVVPALKGPRFPSMIAVQTGAVGQALAKVKLQLVPGPPPIVIFPATSLPCIVGAVPQPDTPGTVPDTCICPPETCSLPAGLVVPMPTLLAEFITIVLVGDPLVPV